MNGIGDVYSAIVPYQANPTINADDQFAAMEQNKRADSADSQSSQQPRLEKSPRESSRTWTRDSLDELEKNHQRHVLRESSITAANVMLPESIEASSQQNLSETSETFDDHLQTMYWDDIGELQEHMPHLQNVGRKSRAHDNAHFECFDYSKGSLVTMETHRLDSATSILAKDFAEAVLDNIPPNIDTRLLVVDDLSSKLIHI